MNLCTLDDVKVVTFPKFPDINGTLVVYEGSGGDAARRVPFVPVRAFSVRTDTPTVRGQHAHKACKQLLVCVTGRCRVRYTDGVTWRDVQLHTPDEGLYLPPTIWAEQHFDPGTILMVLCDQPYAEADYLREYVGFLRFRGLPQP